MTVFAENYNAKNKRIVSLGWQSGSSGKQFFCPDFWQVKRLFLLAAILLCITRDRVFADQVQEFKQTSAQCVSTIEKSKKNLTARLALATVADQLEKLAKSVSDAGELARLLPELNSSAVRCISFARQLNGEVVFEPTRGRFLSAAQIETERVAQETLKEQQRLHRMEAERQAMIQEINKRVFESCAEVALRNPVEAYTNALCVESFKANGIPDQ
ncbi:MAG: hypothetical protein AAFU69_00835 [Pseudomonadota bacterium]